METLLAPLGEINAFREAVECIGNNKLPIHISGCMDTQKCQDRKSTRLNSSHP